MARLLEQFRAGRLEVGEEPADGLGDLPRLGVVDPAVLAGAVVDRGLLAERPHDRDERRDPPVGEPGAEAEARGHGQGDEHGLGPALRDDTDAATRGDGDGFLYGVPPLLAGAAREGRLSKAAGLIESTRQSPANAARISACVTRRGP